MLKGWPFARVIPHIPAVLALIVLMLMTTQRQERVIVIGGGMSGVAAARALANNGVEVIVLEARNRHCGRIWTNVDGLRSPETAVGAESELGASWIHGDNELHPMSQFKKLLGLETVELDEDSMVIFNEAGVMYEDEKYDQFHRLLKKSLANAERRNRDVSIYSEFQKLSGYNTPLSQFWLADFEFDYASPATAISAWYHAEDQEYSGPDALVIDRFNRICEAILSSPELQTASNDLKILYNKVVTEISYGSSQVTVKTTDSTYTADKVIVTVPLGVLKAQSITFTPPLPSKKLQAIERMGFGTVAKLILEFDEVFWENSASFLGLAEHNNEATRGLYTWWVNLNPVVNKPMLMAVALGPNSLEVDRMTDSQAVNVAMANLRKMFPTATNPLHFIRSNWSNDPFAFGAYSFAKTGVHPDDWSSLRAPVARQLYFAGEHTTGDCHSTVHGAYFSGLKAAFDVLGRPMDLAVLPHDGSVCADVAVPPDMLG
eukprot:c4937_g1_i1.p1 GENE.c4937_g1_i1~~c4937_g1_i1.p1  ORF type:complete len:504 (-),score=112.48 c4937_g1_i1:82-1548(-)